MTPNYIRHLRAQIEALEAQERNLELRLEHTLTVLAETRRLLDEAHVPVMEDA